MEVKLDSILAKAYEATRAQKIKWEERNGVFSTTLGDIRLAVLGSPGMYYFIVFNAAGIEITRISSNQLSLVGQLYQLANRQFLKIDETLGNLDNLLDNL